MTLSRKELVRILGENGLRLCRERGQNFLVDGRVLDALLSRVRNPDRRPVLEIGTGLGVLTRRLAETGTRVVSFEVDRGVYRLARKRLQGIEGITLVHGDFLRADSGRYFRGTYLVVANIPYSIAGRILMRLWEESERVAGSYLLVPRELGARLTAPIPGKNAGVLPVLLQTAFRARLVRDVSRTAFFPVPRVDSAYLELLPRKQGLSESERRALRDLLRIGFSQRRKMLLKRLEAAYRNAGGTFRTMGIPENARPEMLSTDQWPELARTLETRRGETGRGDSARRTS